MGTLVCGYFCEHEPGDAVAIGEPGGVLVSADEFGDSGQVDLGGATGPDAVTSADPLMRPGGERRPGSRCPVRAAQCRQASAARICHCRGTMLDVDIKFRVLTRRAPGLTRSSERSGSRLWC